MSQGNAFLFELDRFATRNRYGWQDNENKTKPKNSPSVYTGMALQNEWIESTLPIAMVPDPYDTGDINPVVALPSLPNYKFYIFFNQTFFVKSEDEYDKDVDYKYNSFSPYNDGYMLNLPRNNIDRQLIVDTTKLDFDLDTTKNELKSPDENVPQSTPRKIKIIEGSGGNYLSNEIFYRVSLIRDAWLKKQPSGTIFYSGHFHLPILQFRRGENFYPDLNNTVISIVKERIKRGIQSI